MAFNQPSMMQGQGSAGGTDIVTALQGIIRQLSAWVAAFQGRNAYGTITLAAAATLVVPNGFTGGNSLVIITPTNAAAATLMGSSKALYVSTLSPGVSFTLATADGTNAAGGETFNYILITPV